MVIPDRSLVMGIPAVIIRSVSDEDAAANLDNALHYVREAAEYRAEEEQEKC